MSTHRWTKAEVELIKRVWQDDAGRLALVLIVEGLCGLYRDPFMAESARATDYGLGRRSIGVDLMAAINLPLSELAKEETHERHGTLTATERAARAAAVSYAGGRHSKQR